MTTSSTSESRIEKMEPAYVHTNRELEDIFRQMQPDFEGRETEQNWSVREKHVSKLRKLTQGNAPRDFLQTYLSGFKGSLDGILKTVNSLRTTVCNNGCLLLRETAEVTGSGLDPMVEQLFQNLIKLCGGTKKISAQNANATVGVILAHVTYNIRLVQYVFSACQDKNVQPRIYATGWLKTIITKQGVSKSTLEHAGGVDLIEKSIRKGLADANPSVRECMRGTYWVFARLWPERAENILSGLEAKPKELLINDRGNPGRKRALKNVDSASSEATVNSTSAQSNPNRSTLRETIAAQKIATTIREGPATASSSTTSARPGISSSKTSTTVRPVSAMSGAIRVNSSYSLSTNSHPGTLSSAPVRPMRPARRLEHTRSETADPLPNKKPTKDENSSTSLAGSLLETETKTKDVPSTKSPVEATISTSKMTTSPTTSPFEEKPTKVERSEHPVNKAKTARPAGHVPSPAISSEDIKLPSLPKSKASDDKEPVVQDTNPEPTLQHSTQSLPEPTRNLQQSPAKNKSPRTEPVIACDDQDHTNESEVTAVPFREPTALEELPFNELTNLRSDHVPRSDTESISNSMKPDARDFSKTSKPSMDILRCRKYLDSGISRIPQNTMIDHHGFRKLQDIMASNGDLWEDGTRFNQLLTVLLQSLEAPMGGAQGKASGYKSQVLQTIRVMLQHHRDLFSAHYPQALCAMIRTRKYYDASDRLASGLEEVVEEVTSLCESDESIDAILKLLDDLDVGHAERLRETSELTIMGLSTLKKLLYKVSIGRITLNKVADERLYTLVGRVLKNTDADIRRAGTEYTVALHDYIEPTPKFWDRLGHLCKEQGDLITYYLVKRKSMTDTNDPMTATTARTETSALG